MTYNQSLVKFVFLLISPLIINGCGGDPSFSLSTVNEQVSQKSNDQIQISKIDILWVIDNSGSMKPVQDNLTTNFSAFIENFTQQDFDFQIGVASTDSYKSNKDITNDHRPNNARLRDGSWSTQRSGVYLIDKNTPNLNQVFLTNATLGTKGDGDERALSSLEEFLKEPFNSSFLRENSHLAIIIVSDEDDLSYPGKNNYESIQGNKPSLYDVSRFVNQLNEVTGSSDKTKNYSVSSIHIKSGDINCLNQLKNSTQKFGKRYEDFVIASGGGQENIISLCSDFSDSLKGLSSKIIKDALSPVFTINRRPIVSTIKVRVNGKSVPKSVNNSSGWTYINNEPGVYQISFSEDMIPPPGALVDISFDPFQFED